MSMMAPTPNTRARGRLRLAFFDLRVDGGGDDPALIGERGGRQRGKEGAFHRILCRGGGEVLHNQTGAQPGYSADDCHEQDGHQLDNGERDLELARQPGAVAFIKYTRAM